MGKVTKARTSPAKPATLAPEVLQQVSTLRTAGSGAFLKKEFAKAAESYDQAVKLLPDGAAEKAELLNKKIGCLLSLKKWKEAAKDATTVLELAPTSVAALKSRAKANEQLGFLTKALSDVQAVNRTESATAETREMENRLKDAVKRPGSAPAGGQQVAKPAAAANQPVPRQQELPLVIKATLGSTSKLIYSNFGVSYLDLLDAVRHNFPTAGPVMLKYTDRDGDQIVIASRDDLQVVLSDMVHTFQKHMAALQNKLTMPQHLPPVKITVVPVASEADVPRPPASELAERGQTAEMQEQYQVDEWIQNFARTVQEVTNIDSTSHIEHLNLAGEKLNHAMRAALQSEDSEPIFKEAEEHFRDAVASSYVQWGNVFLSRVDVVMHKLASRLPVDSPEWELSEELKTALGLFDQVEAKINEALKVNPDSWEAVGSLGQLEFERAKAKIGYVLPAPPLGEEDAPPKTLEENQAVANKQLVEVLSKLDPKKVLKAQAHIDKVTEIFERAKGMAKTAWDAKSGRDAERAAKEAAKAKGGEAPADKPAEPAAPPFSSPPSSMLVMHGNMLYDWSNVLSVTGASPWRPVLDAAAVMFRASGAPELDVRAALKNHLRVAELDLGPDPAPAEPKAPATPAAKEAAAAPAADKKAAAPAPEAKGLPSLELKKKPAAAATAAK